MKNAIFYTLVIFISFAACKKPTTPISTGLTPHTLSHTGLPTPTLPPDNPLTKEGIQLGRQLFYEKEMSKDGTISCASCHLQAHAFADTARFSLGVDDLQGKRQAMAIFNMAWNNFEFFWDGRAHLLRDQAVMPIQDPLEMNETLDNVVAKLSAKDSYVRQFKNVFDSEVNATNIALALEQFMFSIVSNKSKYDHFLAGEVSLTAQEERGRKLFFDPFVPFAPNTSGANCASCHGGANFENDSYMNNGLDSFEDMEDTGRENVTNSIASRGQFKVPSLRNIDVTFPYMHDGRFATLEEVIDHYDHGVQFSPTLNATLGSIQNNGGLALSTQDKTDLIAFLKTLTDESLLTSPAFSDPF